MAEECISVVAIDDAEIRYLLKLLDGIFGIENYIGIITSLCNPQGRVADKVSKTSEYHILHAKRKEHLGDLRVLKNQEQSQKGVRLMRTGTNSRRHERPLRFYPILCKKGILSMISREEYEKYTTRHYVNSMTLMSTHWRINMRNKDMNFFFPLAKTVNILFGNAHLIGLLTKFQHTLSESEQFLHHRSKMKYQRHFGLMLSFPIQSMEANWSRI